MKKTYYYFYYYCYYIVQAGIVDSPTLSPKSIVKFFRVILVNWYSFYFNCTKNKLLSRLLTNAADTKIHRYLFEHFLLYSFNYELMKCCFIEVLQDFFLLFIIISIQQHYQVSAIPTFQEKAIWSIQEDAKSFIFTFIFYIFKLDQKDKMMDKNCIIINVLL